MRKHSCISQAIQNPNNAPDGHIGVLAERTNKSLDLTLCHDQNRMLAFPLRHAATCRRPIDAMSFVALSLDRSVDTTAPPFASLETTASFESEVSIICAALAIL